MTKHRFKGRDSDLALHRKRPPSREIRECLRFKQNRLAMWGTQLEKGLIDEIPA